MNAQKVKNPILYFGKIAIAFLMCFTMFSFSIYAEEGKTSKRVVRVACGINNGLYLNENGEVSGSLASYMEELGNVNDWDLQYVEVSWSESVQRLNEGTIDLLTPTQITEERKETMLFSKYIVGYQPIVLFAKSDTEVYYNDYAEFEGKRIGVNKDSFNEDVIEQFAKEHSFSYTPVYFNTQDEIFNALENDSVDMVVYSTFHNVPNSKIVAQLDYFPFYLTTRIDDTELMNEVNEGMGEILAENPNIASDVYNAVLKGSSSLSNTKEEEEIIRQGNTIRVGIFDDSLPLSGRNENGEAIGIYIDLLKEIEKNVGLPIEPVLIPRKVSLYSEIDSGNVDFVMGSKTLLDNEDDKNLYTCSESIMDYISVAITRSDYSFEESDAIHFTITQARKYLSDRILEQFPNATITYCEDVKEALIAVSEGKADATYVNTWEYNYQSKNERFAGMMEWESLRKKTELVLGEKKDSNSALLSIMQKGISQVSDTAKDSVVTVNLNMPYSSYDFADHWFVMKNIVYAVGLILFIIIVAFVLFVQERHDHIKVLEEKNKQLQSANVAKSEFLSRMSHDMRTPMNGILGVANLCDEETDPAVLKEDIGKIKESGQYLLSLINDTLDIHRIESGKMKLEPAIVNLNEVIQNIVEMMSRPAKDKGVLLDCDLGNTNLDWYTKTDALRFKQIFINLLSNAIKFTPEGGTIEFKFRTVSEDDTSSHIEAIVRDTGIGMSEDFLKNGIFKPFSQENNEVSTVYVGSGLGLSIAKSLVELMGGTMEVESELGEGTTFTINLDFDKVSEEEIQKTVQTDEKKAKHVSMQLCGLKILLAEDHPLNAEIAMRILKKQDCHVTWVQDGQMAVDALRDAEPNTYDVVLMDIRMPNMDGLQATREIRKMDREDTKKIPIVAMSANAYEEDIQKSLDAGMNEHLAKPIDPEKLYVVLAKYATNCKI